MNRDMKNHPKFLKVIAGKIDIDGDEYDKAKSLQNLIFVHNLLFLVYTVEVFTRNSWSDSIFCAGETKKAEKVINHPQYKNFVKGFDIALIKTQEPFWLNGVRRSFSRDWKNKLLKLLNYFN